MTESLKKHLQMTEISVLLNICQLDRTDEISFVINVACYWIYRPESQKLRISIIIPNLIIYFLF